MKVSSSCVADRYARIYPSSDGRDLYVGRRLTVGRGSFSGCVVSDSETWRGENEHSIWRIICTFGPAARYEV